MEDAGFKNVEPLINRFGGMRPMARKVNVPVSTIQGWKKRDYIPADRVDDVIKAAKANAVSLSGYRVSMASPSGSNENTAPVQVQDIEKRTDAPIGATPKPADKLDIEQPKAEQPKEFASSVTPPRASARATTSNNDRYLKRQVISTSFLTTVSIMAVIGAVGYFLFAGDVQKVSQVAQNQEQLDTQINGLNEKYASFENTVTDGLNSLSQRVTDVAAAVGVERNEQGEIVLNKGMSMGERVTALESRMRAEGEEIDLGQMLMNFRNMSQSFEGQGDMDTAMTDLKGIVTMLQGRMGQMDAALAQAKSENAELAQSLENVTGRDLGAAAMLLALTQFRSSMNREEPFASDLEILQGLVGQDDPELTAAIDRLAPHAEKGVLNPEGLSTELRSMTGDIIAAKLRGEDVSLKDRVLARIGQILSVEKDGTPLFATKEQEIIAAAQQSLDEGDIEGAMAQLNQLDGDAAAAAQPFMNQAQGTLAAEETSQLLMQKFLEMMQQPGGMQKIITDIPAQIKGATNGTVKHDPASGIIILE